MNLYDATDIRISIDGRELPVIFRSFVQAEKHRAMLADRFPAADLTVTARFPERTAA